MMHIGALNGLLFGIIFALGCVYIGKKAALKNRNDDEVSQHIWQKARSTSWYVTTVTIYILLILVLLGVAIPVFKVLSILLLVHLFSWAIIGSYLSGYYFKESKADAQVYKFLIGFFLVLSVTFIIVMLFII